jgi:putative copper resistance protein D
MIDPLILARGIHIAATALASGTVFFKVLVAEPAAGATAPVNFSALRRRLKLLVWCALAGAVLSGVAWLVLLSAEILGASILDVCLHGGTWQVVTDTRFGLVWCARLVVAILLGMLLRWPRTGLLQSAAAAGLLGALAFIGHAGATPGASGQMHLASDFLHLVAAGGWVGALPALALLLDHARRAKGETWDSVATNTARRFSILGIISVGTLLATGLVNSWNLLAAPLDLITTDYGRLLVLKIGLFAAMVYIAAFNRFSLTPRLALPRAMRALERNAFIETGLGLCVIAVVGALGTMAPPVHSHVHVTISPIPSDAAFVHIHSEPAMAEVTIEPGRRGLARATILLMREDFSLFTAKAVQFVFTPKAQPDAPVISRAATRRADGTWEVDKLEISQSGVWVVKLKVKADNLEPFVLDAPVVIDR